MVVNNILILDDEDKHLLNRKWYQCADGRIAKAEGGRIHRFIIDCPDGHVVDHINGNTLDNRKSNLRICKQTENTYNGRKRVVGTSKYKGVHFDKGTKKWRARITPGGKSIHLGLYETQEEAAIAYDNAAIKYYGEFACLNKEACYR